jgi:hypothetical protein
MMGQEPRGGNWLELRRAEGDDLGAIANNLILAAQSRTKVWVVTRFVASLLEIDEPKEYSPLIAPRHPKVDDLGCPFKRRRKGVQRQGSQQIAAHSPLDFSESLGSAVDPGKVCGLRQLL